MQEDRIRSIRSAAEIDGDEQEVEFKALTREQVEALRQRSPIVSPWRVVAGQAAVGLLCTAAAWLLSGDRGAASAAYGAAAVVLPAALMVRGISRNPGGSVAGFAIWEAVKVALAVFMLGAAAIAVPDLHWPALLITLIACLKAYWVALMLLRRPSGEARKRV